MRENQGYPINTSFQISMIESDLIFYFELTMFLDRHYVALKSTILQDTLKVVYPIRNTRYRRSPHDISQSRKNLTTNVA